MQYYLFVIFKKSISLSFDSVLNKDKYNKSEYPYAKAFCYFYFRTTSPAKTKLLKIAPSIYTIPEIMNMLNVFISSNGNRTMNLNYDFIISAFPSLKNKVNFRFDNHYQMNLERNFKLNEKENNKYKELINSNRNYIKILPYNLLSKWVYENDHVILEYDLITLLCDWYVLHKYGSALDFHYSFEGQTSQNIALELSFIELEYEECNM